MAILNIFRKASNTGGLKSNNSNKESNSLENKLVATSSVNEPRPVFFNLTKEEDRKTLECLFEEGDITVRDTFENQIKELFSIRHPSVNPRSEEHAQGVAKFRTEVLNGLPFWQAGVWVYFPWKRTLIHLVDEESYFELRTARNRNLITKEEQKKFGEAVIGIAGLSVGNSVALAIALQGGPTRMHLTDLDTLDASNLNRIRSGIDMLSVPKVFIAAQQIYELNPYAQLTIFPEGFSKDNAEKFLDGVQLVVDEMDNLPMKVLLRFEARKRSLPVVMATDNGDNALLDIERFDQDQSLPILHGRLGDITPEYFDRPMTPLERAALATKVVGAHDVVPRMQDSLLEVGRTLYSWPQLGGAALLGGSAAAYCVRKIITGEPVKTGRCEVSFDQALDPVFNTEEAKREREEHTREFLKTMSIEG